MDDIEVEEEYDAPLTENFDLGDRDNNDETNNEANIVQQDEAGDISANPMMILSRQVNTDVAWDQDVVNQAFNNT